MFSVTTTQGVLRPTRHEHEKDLLSRIGQLVTRARCVAVLVSMGMGAIVVGGVCISRARHLGERTGDQKADPLTTTGVLLLTMGTIFFVSGISVAIFACCFSDTTFSNDRWSVNWGAQQHELGQREASSAQTDSPPPPYPGYCREEDPPPSYPGL